MGIHNKPRKSDLFLETDKLGNSTINAMNYEEEVETNL